jgi:hypothetical protein
VKLGRLGIGVGTAVAAMTICIAAAPVQETPRVNEDARLMVEFNQRVNEYIDLHRKLEGKLPALASDATLEEVDAHQRALERLIQRARSNARQGDLFTKDIRALFRRNLYRVFKAPEGASLKATIMEENPGPIRLSVNGRFPDGVPLPTVPPQVLDVLPRLPTELEYRFIGNRLVLLDVHAHTIVDIIDNPMPD